MVLGGTVYVYIYILYDMIYVCNMYIYVGIYRYHYTAIYPIHY